MKINDVILAYPNLKKMSEIVDLNTGLKYKIFSALNAIDESLRFFEGQRRLLLEKYGESDGSGNPTIKPEYLEEFTKAATDLANTEVDINFKKGVIKSDVVLPLSAKEIGTIVPFFDFED